jgi:hypothetical protein
MPAALVSGADVRASGSEPLNLFCKPSLNSRDPRRAPRYLCCRPPGRSSPPGIPS